MSVTLFRTLHVLILILLLLWACSKSPQLPPLPSDGVILAFGDSLTSGAGANAGHDYPSVLAELTGRRVINAGVPGELSREGAARLEALLERHNPELLILIHGGNDMLRKLDIDLTQVNLAAMIAMVQARGIPVVMMGVPKPGIFLSSAPFYEKLAEQAIIPIDTETLPEIFQSRALKSDPFTPMTRVIDWWPRRFTVYWMKVARCVF